MTYPIPPSDKQPSDPEVVELLRYVKEHLVPVASLVDEQDFRKSQLICIVVRRSHFDRLLKARLIAYVNRNLQVKRALDRGITCETYEDWLWHAVPEVRASDPDPLPLRRQKTHEARRAWLEQMIEDFS